MPDVKRRDVDGGWAWVVLVASVVNLAIIACFVVSVSIFQVEFLETFPSSKGFIALVGSLALSGQTFLGPVAGILGSVLSPRVVIMMGCVLQATGLFAASFAQDPVTLLVLFGLFTGMGGGLCYTPSVTVISTFFHDYRVVANGISLAAPGLGILAGPFLLRWLIEAHGWRFAMAILGCIMAQTCVLAALFFPHDPSVTPSCCCCRRQQPDCDPDYEPDRNPDQVEAAQPLQVIADRRLARLKEGYGSHASIREMVGSRTALHVSEFGSMLLSNSVIWSVEEVTSTSSSSLRQRIRHLLSKRFMWVMCLNQFLLMSGFSINSVHFAPYSVSVGVPFADLPSLYMVYGITMTTSRIAGGFIFSRVPNQLLKIFFCFQVCVAFVLGLLPLYGVSKEALFLYNFLVGVTYGPTFLLVQPILIYYVGLEDLSAAFGVIMLCCGVAYVVGPPLGGIMFDVFGSYRVSYYIAGSLIGAAALSLLLLALIEDLNPVDSDSMESTIAVRLIPGDPSDPSDSDHSAAPPSHQEDNGKPRNGGVSHEENNGKPRNGGVSHGKENGKSLNGGVSHEEENGKSRNCAVSHGEENGKSLNGGVSDEEEIGKPRNGVRTDDKSRGMHVITDMEDLHQYIRERHS